MRQVLLSFPAGSSAECHAFWVRVIFYSILAQSRSFPNTWKTRCSVVGQVYTLILGRPYRFHKRHCIAPVFVSPAWWRTSIRVWCEAAIHSFCSRFPLIFGSIQTTFVVNRLDFAWQQVKKVDKLIKSCSEFRVCRVQQHTEGGLSSMMRTAVDPLMYSLSL